MRILYCILLAGIFAFSACSNSSSDDEEVSTANVGVNKSSLPVLTFAQDKFDFGTITQGEVVSHFFKFKNTGKSNLIITDAHGSCGCTVPKWQKEPIKPGDSGVIEVTFDSFGKSGAQKKTEQKEKDEKINN